jgi:hypothetical protein
MKNSICLAIILLFLFHRTAKSQTINWFNPGTNNQYIVTLNLALEHGLTYGISLGYKINASRPTILNIEYSAPFGRNIYDDFKIKMGGQVSIYQSNDFQFIATSYGVFRRIENEHGRLLNFGVDLSGIAGYYTSNWFTATEIGFDKAVVTNFKHTKLYKTNFPIAKNGWYEPATGGNFYYGLLTGISLKQTDVFLKLGKMLIQDFKTKPAIPFYSKIGISIK